jgi:hypothetical protein
MLSEAPDLADKKYDVLAHPALLSDEESDAEDETIINILRPDNRSSWVSKYREC